MLKEPVRELSFGFEWKLPQDGFWAGSLTFV